MAHNLLESFITLSITVAHCCGVTENTGCHQQCTHSHTQHAVATCAGAYVTQLPGFAVEVARLNENFTVAVRSALKMHMSAPRSLNATEDLMTVCDTQCEPRCAPTYGCRCLAHVCTAMCVYSVCPMPSSRQPKGCNFIVIAETKEEAKHIPSAVTALLLPLHNSGHHAHIHGDTVISTRVQDHQSHASLPVHSQLHPLSLCDRVGSS